MFLTVKVSYDPDVEAAYIYLTEIGPGGVDFDAEGRLVGIEVLKASQTLPKHLLEGQA
jgi:uncharacterized protein YuzE